MERILLLLLCFGLSLACNFGYYEVDGQCKTCHDSCKECSPDNPNICTACMDYMQLNSITGMCEACGSNEYFVQTADECFTCGSKCNNLCAYKEECFECPADQYYDIAKMKCVTECSESSFTTQYVFEDFTTVAMCRPLSYYINPDSEKILELGTIDYPFKNINLAFIELVNEHSNSNRSVSIYVMEKTYNYISNQAALVINITAVTIDSYSLLTPSDPSRANFVVTDSSSNLKTNRTLFNLMQNTALGSYDTSAMLAEEKSEVESAETSIIIVNRCDFHINNIDVVHEISSSSLTVDFIYTAYNHEFLVNMTNIYIQLQGKIYENNIMSANFYAENITCDMQDATGGFIYTSSCSLQGEDNLSELELRNIYAYTSGDSPIPLGFLTIGGTANLTVYNMTLDVFTNEQILYPILGYFPAASCSPQDDVLQFIKYDLLVSKLTDNPTSDRTGALGFYMPTYTTRTFEINITNSLFDQRINDSRVELGIIGSYGETLTLTNVTCTNSDSNMSFLYLAYMSKVIVNGLNFTSNELQSEIFNRFEAILTVEITDFVFSTNAKISDSAVWNEVISAGTSFSLNNATFSDLSIQTGALFRFSGTFSSINLNNINFSNIDVGTSSSIIYFTSMTSFIFSTLSFNNITSESSSDSDNYMIGIDTINLAVSGSTSLSNISVTNSTIGFFSLTGLTGTQTAESSFVIDSVQITDSEIPTFVDIFHFSNFQSQANYTIVLNNLAFQNLDFVFGGNLLGFGHLMKIPIQVNNLTVSSISGGKIYLEAYSTPTSELKTMVECYSIIADDINSGYSSLISVNTGSLLTISNSRFTRIHSYEEGSVIYAGETASLTQISDSVFNNNTAVLGGVFFTEASSTIECQNCTFYNNFGVEGGVIATSNNGYFAFSNSYFYRNYAVAGLVANLFSSANEASITNSSIHDNVFVNSDTILNEINTQCSKLCFFKEDFSMYIANNPSVLDVVPSASAVKSIIGVITLNDTEVYSQNQLINGYSSSLDLNNVDISSVVSEDYLIKFSQSSLAITESTIINVTNPSETPNPLIFGTSDCEVSIDGLDYSSGESALILFRNVTGTINQLQISDVSSIDYMLYIDLCYDLNLQNSTLSNVSSLADSVMRLGNGRGNVLQSLFIDSIDQLVLKVEESNGLEIRSLQMSKCGQAIQILSRSSVTITNSTLSHIGSDSIISGGVVYSVNSNLTVESSKFSNCSAQSGGCLALICSTNRECIFSLSSTRFVESSALVKGGAIYYNLYRPSLDSVVFQNNSATYGPNIASYPVKIALHESNSTAIKLEDVVSSQVYDKDLRFDLVDHDEQIVSIENSAKAKIRAVEEGTSVGGTSEAIVTQGVATFDDLVFVAQPGSKNITFEITCTAIDNYILDLQYNGMVETQYIDASFRFCQSGEIERNGECQVCSPGTYALGENQTQCISCMDNAVCLGGKEINVNSGYFRSSLDSPHLIECIREDSCKGGYYEDTEYPVECAKGYAGLLCAECVITDETKYERNSNFVCSKCPNKVLNIIRITGIMLAILFFLTMLIIINVRKRGESQKSTLMRIMTNYLQVISTALSFGANFPKVVSDIFLPIDTVGSSSESFVSLDCFVADSDMNVFAPTSAIFKIFLTTLVPIVLILFYVAAWYIMYLVAKKWFGDIKRNIMVSVIVILFLLHPALTKAGLSIFQCVKVDEDESGDINRARADLDMECYSGKHIAWITLVGLPNVIIWGFGIPITGLTILLKYRRFLGTWSVQKYLLMLYQGLKQDRYYWELINTLRKILLLSIVTFMSTSSLSYRALSATVVLVIMLRVQLWLKPYKLESNNNLETSEIITGTYTLFASMVFEEEKNEPVIDLIIFIFMVILNVRFILTWTYWMLVTERGRFKFIGNIVACLEVVLCRRKTISSSADLNEDENEFEKVSKKYKKKVKNSKSLKKVRKVATKARNMKKSAEKELKNSRIRSLDLLGKLQVDSVSNFAIPRKIRNDASDQRMPNSKDLRSINEAMNESDSRTSSKLVLLKLENNLFDAPNIDSKNPSNLDWSLNAEDEMLTSFLVRTIKNNQEEKKSKKKKKGRTQKRDFDDD